MRIEIRKIKNIIFKNLRNKSDIEKIEKDKKWDKKMKEKCMR